MTANKQLLLTLASVDGALSAGMARFTFCRAASWSNLGIQSRGETVLLGRKRYVQAVV